jgi:hypothetical protein
MLINRLGVTERMLERNAPLEVEICVEQMVIEVLVQYWAKLKRVQVEAFSFLCGARKPGLNRSHHKKEKKIKSFENR